MSKDLQLYNEYANLVHYMPEHKEMIAVIQQNLPEIHRATSLFGKSQSQFMDNVLTVSHPTPLRNMRQILAEVNKAKQALTESYFSIQKKDVEKRKKIRQLETTKDPLDRELLEIEINELCTQMQQSELYVSGAIRKITAYMEQYNAIAESIGKKEFNEEDFEAEEEKYHIMKAFDQALAAARTRMDGSIDEGNMIYLHQIGVNGAVAQIDMKDFLNYEQQILNSKNELGQQLEPTYNLQAKFLADMAEKHKGCSKIVAKNKGMIDNISKVALLQTGDTRLK